jgi:3-phenylpropionate/cinnamic acid dioxygenase small subunit
VTTLEGTSLDLQLRVNAFYARETMLLDDDRLDEWLEVLAEDVSYTMPATESRQGPADPAEDEFPPFLLFNDDKESLHLRVARLRTGLAPGETPKTIMQRFVSDILITDVNEHSVSVRSSVLLFLVRHERHEGFFVGRRQDTLLLQEDGLRLSSRNITLAHSVLPRTISVFF